LENSRFLLTVSDGIYHELLGERIDRFGTYPVEADGFFKRFGIVFSTRVDSGYAIHHLPQSDTPSIIPDLHAALLGYMDFDFLPVPHHVFIDRVVQDLLDQDIDPVVGRTPVAEFSDVHPGAESNVFFPVE